MNISASLSITFLDDYRQTLEEYVLVGAGEEVLMQAYELGRRAVAEQRNILDLMAIHHETMMNAAVAAANAEQRRIYLCRSEEFLAEVMAPFEMMHRGFVDTIRQLQEINATLEQRVENRTRALRESQQKSADLARLYLILSNINSAIVRLRTRKELLKEACRIAVNQGGYLAAGVVLRDPDAQTLQDRWFRLTRAGSSTTEMPIDSVSKPVRGALQAVYQTGKHVVCLLEGRHSVAWNGISLDYTAYAMFPLMLDREVAGVLVLFSKEEGSFNVAEMRLLLEMAGDLSFSLEHIQRDKQLNYLAYYDALTGLANLSLLLERIPVQIEEAKRSGMMVAMLLIDLVNFSDINDTYGRHVGDSLLKQVGSRLCEAVGSCETVAKLGVGHFALSFSHNSETNRVAHKLEKDVMQAFVAPFRVEGTDIHLAIQVGISLFPSDAVDAETLYKNAKIALKRAQEEGRSYLLYDPAMNERIIHSVTMEAKLRKAIERNQLVVHYQPKVSTTDKSIVGLEALLRFADPEGDIVPPDNFIHLLEETGMIIEVGFWMMRQAAKDLQLWRRTNLSPPGVAVNVSPIQLEQQDFLVSLQTILNDTNGRSNGLDIEITESAVMTEVEKNIPKLKALREMGFQIAIDDFGTGYSSLSYLSRLPVNALKIDRSFIIDMTEHSNSLAIVTSIISLAHSLDLQVIAEGVEWEEQAKLLRLLRCDFIQGFLYSPPLPAEGIIALLQHGHPW